MSGLTRDGTGRDGTADPVSRDQIRRRERGQGVHFSCSADHEQDSQPYPFDPYSATVYVLVKHIYIQTTAGHPGGSVGNLETF